LTAPYLGNCVVQDIHIRHAGQCFGYSAFQTISIWTWCPYTGHGVYDVLLTPELHVLSQLIIVFSIF